MSKRIVSSVCALCVAGLFLFANSIAAQAPSVIDRSVRRITFVDNGEGYHSVRVELGFLLDGSLPTDLSTDVAIKVGNTAPIVTTETVVVAATGSCATAPTYSCSSGTCQMTVNGSTQTGTCITYSCVSEDTLIEVCACEYRVTKTYFAGADLHPGDEVTVTASEFPGSAADICGDNDRLTVFFGSRADHQSCNPGPSRKPVPMGGQPATPATGLDQSGLFRQGAGPFEFWGAWGASASSLQTGLPGLPMSLFLGVPKTGWAYLPGLGSVDLDFLQSIFVLYDGIGIVQNPDGTNGPVVAIPYTLPAQFTGSLASLQGLSVDPSAPIGLRLSERNDIGVQDPSSLPPARLQPFAGTQPYPQPRDAICPNNGPVSSSIGANDGTLHSALGRNFDATAPGATTATVNGQAVDIFVVRPREILFYLNPTHRPSIAGPLVVTSTGGSFPAPPDQMESWVFATPARVWSERPNAASPALSGILNREGGLQAVQGIKDQIGQSDHWLLHGLPPGTSIHCVLAQIDPSTGQIISSCSPFAGLPPSLCFDPLLEPWTQMPSVTDRANMLLHIAAASNPGVFLASQDDAGPGSISFAGSSVGAAATNPIQDPPNPFLVSLASDHLLVVEEWQLPGTTYPVPYIAITYW